MIKVIFGSIAHHMVETNLCLVVFNKDARFDPVSNNCNKL